MTEQLISFETAKLAKEKGFDIPTLYGCNEQGELLEYFTYASYSPGEPEIRIDEFINKWEYQLPTQSLLQKWLREKYNQHIYLFPLDKGKWGFENNSISINLDHIFINYMYEGKEYNSYEEALEVGLQEALKLVKF